MVQAHARLGPRKRGVARCVHALPLRYRVLLGALAVALVAAVVYALVAFPYFLWLARDDMIDARANYDRCRQTEQPRSDRLVRCVDITSLVDSPFGIAGRALELELRALQTLARSAVQYAGAWSLLSATRWVPHEPAHTDVDEL